MAHLALHVAWHALRRWLVSLAKLLRAVFVELPAAALEHILLNPYAAAQVVFWCIVIAFVAHVLQILQPVLEEAAHVTYTVADGIQDVLDAIISALNDIVGAFTGFASDVSSFFGGPSISSPDIPDPDLTGHLQWARDGPPEICAHFHSTYNVLTFATQRALNRPVCPVARHVWGTWLHPVVAWLLGWAYIDDTPGGNNCGVPDGSVFCEVANVWRIWWILVTFIVVGFFAAPLRPVIKRAVLTALDAAWLLLVLLFLVARVAVRPSRFTAAKPRDLVAHTGKPRRALVKQGV
jgi:hypothetical protein